MSVLRDRIMSQGEPEGGASYHPVGTGQTPMVMPLAFIEYDGETALYQTAHPMITADGAVIPGRAPFMYPGSVPRGRTRQP